MHSLLVSHQFKERAEGAFEFSKGRFLEYTSDSIAEQLRPLSIEADDCLKSWPCALMQEGRGEERVQIGRITDIRDAGMEIRLTIKPNDATRFGIKLLCSNGCEEETVVTYDAQQQEFVIDFENASEDKNLTYAGREGGPLPSGSWKQTVPYALSGNRALDLDIFVDRSVVEIFVNSEICIVQRVYPTRDDSKGFRLFTRDRGIRAENIVKWEMDATNPW